MSRLRFLGFLLLRCRAWPSGSGQAGCNRPWHASPRHTGLPRVAGVRGAHAAWPPAGPDVRGQEKRNAAHAVPAPMAGEILVGRAAQRPTTRPPGHHRHAVGARSSDRERPASRRRKQALHRRAQGDRRHRGGRFLDRARAAQNGAWPSVARGERPTTPSRAASPSPMKKAISPRCIPGRQPRSRCGPASHTRATARLDSACCRAATPSNRLARVRVQLGTKTGHRRRRRNGGRAT